MPQSALLSTTSNEKTSSLPERSAGMRYAHAVLAVVLVTLLRIALEPWLQTHVSFMLYLVAVMYSSWYGGLRPGVLTIFLGAILGTFLFAHPRFSLGMYHFADFVSLLLFVLSSAVIALLNEAHNRAQAQAEKSAEEAREKSELLEQAIKERERVQEQLFKASKLESLGRMAGGISHDFNNLLTAISGYTELALSELEPDSSAAPLLTNVVSAADRAAGLTQQLLMYARRQVVEFTTVDLNVVIQQMESLLRRSLGDAHALTLALQEALWYVHSNVSQMEQVLLNLTMNARDAMPRGGHVRIETANVILDAEFVQQNPDIPPGAYVMLAVHDTGIGMTQDVQERIFEPFFTTKEIGRGTGLGLASVYGVVKQSEGYLQVLSAPGQGTTFQVYLPRKEEARAPEPLLAPTGRLTGTATILLVDDEPMVRDIGARALRAQGYEVLEASSGTEALEMQKNAMKSIDLLVTDVVMPQMSGKELAEQIQATCPDMKVLYVSGYTHNVILEQGIMEEGHALLAKPFTAFVLLEKVRDVLNAE